ncbi:hypothetical protein EJB05_32644 [Eragrostis curvula]|uniref:Uncharacterized protein n=1 Tax=Eragrostis curvula TaxID=38414 RepID=A0A5J9UGQ6_9POAL|nr:hypothetical protein EJB05_32644 [Eragrostis curvula]
METAACAKARMPTPTAASVAAAGCSISGDCGYHSLKQGAALQSLKHDGDDADHMSEGPSEHSITGAPSTCPGCRVSNPDIWIMEGCNRWPERRRQTWASRRWAWRWTRTGTESGVNSKVASDVCGCGLAVRSTGSLEQERVHFGKVNETLKQRASKRGCTKPSGRAEGVHCSSSCGQEERTVPLPCARVFAAQVQTCRLRGLSCIVRASAPVQAADTIVGTHARQFQNFVPGSTVPDGATDVFTNHEASTNLTVRYRLLLKVACERIAKRILSIYPYQWDGSSIGFLETLENDLSLLQEKDFHAIGLRLAVEGCTLPSNVIRTMSRWYVAFKGRRPTGPLAKHNWPVSAMHVTKAYQG